MRFTVPFLLAIAVFTVTVLGANLTSFNPNDDLLFDIVMATDALAFRVERALGLNENLSLIIGGLMLSLPALLAFHLFRVGFGGSAQAIVQEEQVSRIHAAERERAYARRVAREQPTAEEVFAGRRRTAASDLHHDDGQLLDDDLALEQQRRDAVRSQADSGDGERRRGLNANIAAAFAGRGADRSPSGSATTNLSGDDDIAPQTKGRLRDRWGRFMDKKPDLTRFKSGTENLRSRIRRSSSSSTSLHDLADNGQKKPT